MSFRDKIVPVVVEIPFKIVRFQARGLDSGNKRDVLIV